MYMLGDSLLPVQLLNMHRTIRLKKGDFKCATPDKTRYLNS